MIKQTLPLCGALLLITIPAVAQTPAAKPAASKPAAVKPVAPKPVAPKPVAPKPVATPVVLPPSAVQHLEGGVGFLPIVDRTSPRVAFSILLRVGAADETPEIAGWRRLVTNTMLRRAPKGYDVGANPIESLSRAAAKLGGQVGASVGDDLIEIYGVGDSSNGTKLLELALDVFKNPALTDEDLDAVRIRQQEQLEADDFDITSKVGESLRKQLFKSPEGDLRAYGLSELGTPESLRNLTNDVLRQLYVTKISGAKITVSAVGDVDVVGMRNILKNVRSGTSKEAPAPVFVAPKKDAPPLVVRELPTLSSWVFVSYPLGNSMADGPALRVLSAALADSKNSRLTTRLLGNPLIPGGPVALTVSSQWVHRRYAGELLLSAQTSPQSVDRVKNALIDEVRKLREGKLTPQELERAKTYARGTWSLERQNLRERSFLMGESSALGGPDDSTWPLRLQAVTADDISRVANKYLNSYAVALVMPRER
jgi:predicted Zn-dependent peptidase